MTQPLFVAAKGCIYKDSDAAIIGPELSRIAASSPNPDKWLIVDAARDPSSPLHPYIFRDGDRDAAHKYRGLLAGRITRAILVRLPATDEYPSRDVRAFEYAVKVRVVSPEAGEPTPQHVPVIRRRPTDQLESANVCRRMVPVTLVMSDAAVAEEIVRNLEVAMASFRSKLTFIRRHYPGFQRRLGRPWRQLERLFQQPAESSN